jgi:hypothetical protein
MSYNFGVKNLVLNKNAYIFQIYYSEEDKQRRLIILLNEQHDSSYIRLKKHKKFYNKVVT